MPAWRQHVLLLLIWSENCQGDWLRKMLQESETPALAHRGSCIQLLLRGRSAAVIHVELDWVRGHPVAVLFFLLQFEI